jgi:hypothetical protein
MAYFNHAYKKTFIATKANQPAATVGQPNGTAAVTGGILSSTGVHVSNLKSTMASEGYQLGPGVTGMFDAKTNLSVTAAEIAESCCPFYLAGASIKTNDKQGPFHGGYQESHKSKIINPKYVRRTYKVVGNAATPAVLEIGGTVDNVVDNASCAKTFLCGETYYLRVEVKGTAALRFANHNLYQTLQADGGCCSDPSAPANVDPTVIYKQWGQRIKENPYMVSFIRPILVVDGDSYAFTAEDAIAEGLDPATNLVSDAPAVSTSAGLILKGAYVDTKFGNCTFNALDYYGIEPIQIYASEVDLQGDPCTFGGVCVIERCPGIQVNGSGEQKVRELLMSESYLQNFMADDLRIREITQGTRVYEVLDRNTIYSSFYILHSVPRFSNPSGVYDNDQYLIEIVGTSATLTYLTAQFDAIAAAGCITCGGVEDFSVTGCEFELPAQTESEGPEEPEEPEEPIG